MKEDLKWLHFMVACEAHRVAGVHTRTMLALNSVISGAMHLALSVTMLATSAKIQRRSVTVNSNVESMLGLNKMSSLFNGLFRTLAYIPNLCLFFKSSC